MKFGYFDDDNKEYVITTPKTPRPWINYLGEKDFFSLLSNTGGGYTFYKDARLRRLTRYRYNDIPRDSNGKYFMVNMGGEIFSLSWMPLKAGYDSYECRHGMGYSLISMKHKGLRSNVLYFVPLNENAEIQKVALKNESEKRIEFKLYSFVEFCLYDAYYDMTNYQRTLNIGSVEICGSTIYHTTDYKERRNHYAFYSVNSEISGFDTDRDEFVGNFNGMDCPEVIINGAAKNSITHGENPIASHEISLSLEPGETKEFIFILGYVENDANEKWESKGVANKKKALAMIDKYSTSEKVDRAFKELKKYWNGLLSVYHVKSPDDKLDRMVNIWNQYQCMVTFNMSRSASYFETGIGRGMGFRDSNQDILGFVHMIPKSARQRILDLASTQLSDGGAYHQYQPLTKKGNNDIGGGFNDDPLWLILSTISYIKETGDLSILSEEVPFNCDENNKDTLFSHLKTSFDYTLNNLGPHGLPLIGRADWNDCLNLNCFSDNPDESFQTCGNKEGRTAESIFIAGMFVYIGREYADLCRLLNENEMSAFIDSKVDLMEKAVEDYGFDGKWYLRAYDYYGNKVGSHENEEGKIFIEPQGFCSMAEIGKEKGYPKLALDSTYELLNTEYGIVLQSPAYSEYHIELGEISSYPRGMKENGGVFCHNNPWVAIGETRLGRGDRAFEYYSKIAPAYLEDKSDMHKLEPYVYSQMIAGIEAVKPGEAKNSWLTGTASWNFEAVSKWILGIRPDFNGLKVDPCIPHSWKGFEITRKFRNAVYEIEVVNKSGSCRGIKSLICDGTAVSGNVLPVFSDEKTHKCIAVM